MKLFPRVQILVRFQTWLLGIWRACTGQQEVDWHEEVNDIVDIANDAIDLRTHQATNQPSMTPNLTALPNQQIGTIAEKTGTVSDRVFMEAMRRRRSRRQLDKFQM